MDGNVPTTIVLYKIEHKHTNVPIVDMILTQNLEIGSILNALGTGSKN